MRGWRRRRVVETDERQDAPLVLTVTDPVTAQTVAPLVDRIDRMAPSRRVVVDLTAIPAFDSDGADALVGAQQRYDAGRVSIVGMRQATARLVGDDVAAAPAARENRPGGADADDGRRDSTWSVRTLRAIAVVQPSAWGGTPGRPLDDGGLERAVTDALDGEAAMVVVDLHDGALSDAGVDTIAFASSRAAVRGQELLVVNGDEDTVARLRRVGLSATTYVAPGTS
jgi:anti-anti-sigma regulatory factor